MAHLLIGEFMIRSWNWNPSDQSNWNILLPSTQILVVCLQVGSWHPPLQHVDRPTTVPGKRGRSVQADQKQPSRLPRAYCKSSIPIVKVQFHNLCRNTLQRAEPLSAPSWSRFNHATFSSPHAQESNLLQQLHHAQDPSERLGSENGALGVKQHPYFANTDWELLEQVGISNSTQTMFSSPIRHFSLDREKWSHLLCRSWRMTGTRAASTPSSPSWSRRSQRSNWVEKSKTNARTIFLDSALLHLGFEVNKTNVNAEIAILEVKIQNNWDYQLPCLEQSSGRQEAMWELSWLILSFIPIYSVKL